MRRKRKTSQEREMDKNGLFCQVAGSGGVVGSVVLREEGMKGSVLQRKKADVLVRGGERELGVHGV